MGVRAPAGIAADDALVELISFVTGDHTDPERRRALVAVLPERHPIYAGRSTNATMRIRGDVLAAFEHLGLPDAAFMYAIEELESGTEAYLVAAAAMAVRGLDQPERGLVPFLLRAIDRIRLVDDTVAIGTVVPVAEHPRTTTALAEIFRTFEWLAGHGGAALPRLMALRAQRILPGDAHPALNAAIEAIERDSTVVATVPVASCCDGDEIEDPTARGARIERISERARTSSGPLAGVVLEDESAGRWSYSEAFVGHVTVLAFFYTRCDNPNKCSLTVTKLAELQRAISEAGLDGIVRTAAITYDPAFDVPARLRAYGAQRGYSFGDDHRFFRTTEGFDLFRAQFQLGVNFGEATVNRHQIELCVLDAHGRIAAKASRRQWNVGDVLTAARALMVSG